MRIPKDDGGKTDTHAWPYIHLKSLIDKLTQLGRIRPFVHLGPHSVLRDNDVPRIPEHDGHPDDNTTCTGVRNERPKEKISACAFRSSK